MPDANGGFHEEDDYRGASANRHGQVQILRLESEGLSKIGAILPLLIIIAILTGINTVGFAMLYADKISTAQTLTQVSQKADKAVATSDAANVLAGRTQRQADLSNWTMMNLEGLMVQNHIAVPQTLAPSNLPKEKRK